MPATGFWTSERDALLTLHWRTESAEAIAEIIGHDCTRNMVIGRIWRMRDRLGLDHKNTRGKIMPPVCRKPSKAVWIEAATIEADLVGVSAAALMAGTRSPVCLRARWRAWKRLHDQNYSLSGIGRTSGFDHTAVRHGLRRLAGLAPNDAKPRYGLRYANLHPLPERGEG